MADYLHYVSALIALAFALILVIAGAGAMAAQTSATERHYQRTNQTLDIQDGSTWENGSQLALEDARINYVYGNETITNNGTTLDEGEEYELNQSTGRIRWLNSAQIEEDESAFAEFHAKGHPEAASAVITIQEALIPTLPWVLLVVVAFVVIGLLVGVSLAFGLGADFRSRSGMRR